MVALERGEGLGVLVYHNADLPWLLEVSADGGVFEELTVSYVFTGVFIVHLLNNLINNRNLRNLVYS